MYSGGGGGNDGGGPGDWDDEFGSGSGASGLYFDLEGSASQGESIHSAARRIMLRGRKEASSYISAECSRGGPTPELDAVMDYLFDPEQPIDNSNSIEWVRWLISGGRTPDDFASIGE